MPRSAASPLLIPQDVNTYLQIQLRDYCAIAQVCLEMKKLKRDPALGNLSTVTTVAGSNGALFGLVTLWDQGRNTVSIGQRYLERSGELVMLECVSDVLNASEVEKAVAVMSSSDFVDGKTTAGLRAKRVKNNEQLGRNTSSREKIEELIVNALKQSPLFQRLAMPRIISTPLFSRYREGMEYGLHVDDATMGNAAMRTDVSVTIFLNHPNHYEGGELAIHSPFGVQHVKLPAGAAVVYPSSTLHRVLPVTKGERLAAVTWVQSKVRDPLKREMLYDLDRVCRKLSELDPDGAEADLAFKTHSNLTRMWLD